MREILGAPPACDITWPMVKAAMAALGCDSTFEQIAAAATIQVECAGWLPVREKRADPVKQPKLWVVQERYWGSGYYGRGLLQHTLRANYLRLERALKIPLMDKPDLLLQPENAARAFAWQFWADGATKAALQQDWQKVRRIVNGPGMVHLDRFLADVNRLKSAL